MLRLATAVLVVAGLWQLSGAALIHGKAWLAPVLIERAWEKSLGQGSPVKPWRWADTWPLARLRVEALDITRYVLTGANGASLPFGPGHLDGSALPGQPGSIVIAGHRDTHFGFLDELSPGIEVELTGINGTTRAFRVLGRQMVDARTHGIAPLTDSSELILVTCEPTHAFQYRGPFRLVVTAVPVVSSLAEGPDGQSQKI